MKILVAGAQGQLARALLEAAGAHRACHVVALGRPHLDLLDRATIETAFEAVQPDLVVNAAAYTAVDAAERDPAAAHALNRDGAAALAAEAWACRCPIIHVSTDYLFDGAKAAPYVEDDAAAPASVYGRSKLEGEIAVRETNPRHVILRTAWLHAPYGKNFVTTILRLARERRELFVVSDQRGNPTYAPHLAGAVLAIASRIVAGAPGTPWGTYHAAAEGEADLAGEILRIGARYGLPAPPIVPISTDEYPAEVRRPANSRLDCTRLARSYGIRLPPWRRGVAECVSRLASARDLGASPAADAGGVAPPAGNGRQQLGGARS
jgi:dTDP-4-dehydrorhamnose reductase